MVSSITLFLLVVEKSDINVGVWGGGSIFGKGVLGIQLGMRVHFVM